MTDLVPLSNSLDLEQFTRDASNVHGISKALATTSFVPKPFQNRPDEITAAILFGREIGLDPMVALQSIHVIEGRPSLSALAMRGKAQAAGVKFRLDESTATRCRMSARAPGDEGWTEVTWTMDRAKQLGLTNKSNWQKQPTAMLIARATSELCRLVAANVFLGFAYSTEELSDDGSGFEPVQSDRTAPEAEQPKRTVRRKVQATVDYPEPDPEPPIMELPEPEAPKAIGYTIEDVPPGDEPLVPREDMISPNTRKALMAGFNDLGLRDRMPRLQYVSNVIGREVNSVNQLNETEGRHLLDIVRADLKSKGWPDIAEVPGE